MRKLLSTFTRLFLGRTKRVMVIEAIDEHFEITDARINDHTKIIHIERVRFAHDLNDIPSPIFLYDSVIVALNETDATTVESSIVFNRSNSEEKITSEELDGLLFKALWSFINQHRAWAAQKMEGNELDLILAHVEIGGISIDDHHVVNPIGLLGDKCIIKFRGTFVLRSLLESLSRCISWATTFSIIERGSIVASILPRESATTISVTGNDSFVFIAHKDELKFSHRYSWGRNVILRALSDQFGVSLKSANKILILYHDGHLSDRMTRIVERVVHVALEPFLKGLFTKTRSRVAISRAIYTTFHGGFPLPRKEFEALKVRIAPVEEMLAARDYSVTINPRIHQYAVSGHYIAISLLGRLNNYPVHQFLTQLLSRRARWLTATISHTAEYVA